MKEFFLFVLASIGLCHFLVDGALMAPLKEHLTRLGLRQVVKMLNCYQCAGFWSGVVMGFVVLIAPESPGSNSSCMALRPASSVPSVRSSSVISTHRSKPRPLTVAGRRSLPTALSWNLPRWSESSCTIPGGGPPGVPCARRAGQEPRPPRFARGHFGGGVSHRGMTMSLASLCWPVGRLGEAMKAVGDLCRLAPIGPEVSVPSVARDYRRERIAGKLDRCGGRLARFRCGAGDDPLYRCGPVPPHGRAVTSRPPRGRRGDRRERRRRTKVSPGRQGPLWPINSPGTGFHHSSRRPRGRQGGALPGARGPSRRPDRRDPRRRGDRDPPQGARATGAAEAIPERCLGRVLLAAAGLGRAWVVGTGPRGGTAKAAGRRAGYARNRVCRVSRVVVAAGAGGTQRPARSGLAAGLGVAPVHTGRFPPPHPGPGRTAGDPRARSSDGD